MWNSPHAQKRTCKNGTQYSIPVPIYAHPGLRHHLDNCDIVYNQPTNDLLIKNWKVFNTILLHYNVIELLVITGASKGTS